VQTGLFYYPFCKSRSLALGAVPEVIATVTAPLSLAFPAAGASIAAAMPAIEVVRAAITMGLLGHTRCAGYNHIGSGGINFFDKWHIPHRVSGVRETMQKTLGVAGQPSRAGGCKRSYVDRSLLMKRR
jgi:hypothetical protein